MMPLIGATDHAARRPDPDGVLAAIVAGSGTSAVIGLVTVFLLWATQDQIDLFQIAVGGIVTVTGGAISVIYATVRRRR